ncbi:MAG: helix-turn-helix domain-containing protein [Phycisphaerae bacterium]|nr:helix-turn-helix domain-containing protein [Phycisphaerae bacterium]
MPTTNGKQVLTTGEVARICHVAARTVSKWFDSGKLKGYRIPGSRDRRIPRERLVEFMENYGIPLGDLDGGQCRVLIVDQEAPAKLVRQMTASGQYDVRTADDDFAAGVIAQQFRPHVIVLDFGFGEDQAVAMCKNIKHSPDLQAVKVIAAAHNTNASHRRRLAEAGFDRVTSKPYTPAQLAGVIEDVTNLAT